MEMTRLRNDSNIYLGLGYIRSFRSSREMDSTARYNPSASKAMVVGSFVCARRYEHLGVKIGDWKF